MSSITDQVQALEADHADALTQIASLMSDNASLKSQNVALTSENAALLAKCDELTRHSADVRDMAEQIASSTLDMLRASRRENYTTAPAGTISGNVFTNAASGVFVTTPNPVIITGSAAALQADAGTRDGPAEQINAAPIPPVRTVKEIVEGSAEPLPEFLRRDAVFSTGAVA